MVFFKPSSKVRQLIKVFNYYLPVIFKDVKCFDSSSGHKFTDYWAPLITYTSWTTCHTHNPWRHIERICMIRKKFPKFLDKLIIWMKLNCAIEKWLACRCVHKHVFIFHNIINETDDINIMGGGATCRFIEHSFSECF